MRVKATDATGTAFGGDSVFTTSTCSVAARSITTSAASGVWSTDVSLTDTVNPNGASTTTGFDYGISTAYGSSIAATTLSGSGGQSIAAGLAGDRKSVV